YASGNPPTGTLGSSSYVAEQGSAGYSRPWSGSVSGSSGPLPAINPQIMGWGSESDAPISGEMDDDTLLPEDEPPTEEGYNTTEYQQRESYRQAAPYTGSYGQTPTGPLGQSNTGPLGYPTAPTQHTATTGHMPAINSGNSTVVQSTVDLNMLMDIIETVFDRPTIGTFVLMTGDRDFTRISARLKLRLNKTVIIVGVPGTVSRDLISAASQFLDYIDRNWSWRTVIGISNFVGDSINPKNRFRGRLTRESARELLNVCI